MSPWQEKISRFTGWAFCIAYTGLFFPIEISNLSLFLLVGCSLLILSPTRIVHSIRANRSIQLIILFYLLHVLGLLYSSNVQTGLFVLEKKVTLLVLPLLVFPALHEQPLYEKKRLLFHIGLITVASSVFFLIVAVLKIHLYNFTLAFHQEHFPSVPYVFYAMYFSVGSLLLINHLFDSSAPSWRSRILVFVLAVYSVGILIVVSSKTGIIAHSVGLTYLFYSKLSSKKLFAGSFIGLVVILIIFLLSYPPTLNRFKELTANLSMVTEDKLTEYEEFTGLNLRLFFWKSAITQVWEDRRLLGGVGPGDAQDFLDYAYANRNLDRYGFTHFDPHNQWIETLVQLGLFGILLLASAYWSGVSRSLKSKDPGFIFFSIVTLCFSFSESILESNKGVVFFSLMMCVLVSLQKTEPQKVSVHTKSA